MGQIRGGVRKIVSGRDPIAYQQGVENDFAYTYSGDAVTVGGQVKAFEPVESTRWDALPTTYTLYQYRLNPARGTVTIAFELPEEAPVTLAVYDISGRKVTTVVDMPLPAGTHETEVSGLAPGVYVYKLDAGTFSAARKMVVVE